MVVNSGTLKVDGNPMTAHVVDGQGNDVSLCVIPVDRADSRCPSMALIFTVVQALAEHVVGYSSAPHRGASVHQRHRWARMEGFYTTKNNKNK